MGKDSQYVYISSLPTGRCTILLPLFLVGWSVASTGEP
jgi:hypothetical protein